jgi:serine/threonine protein kinase
MSRREAPRSPRRITESNNAHVWNTYKTFYTDYEILRLLGKGTFGKAVLAKNRKTGRLFTVKMMYPNPDEDDERHTEVEMLIRTREMRNVCTYFDRFVLLEEGKKSKPAKSTKGVTHCLQLDYIAGTDLRRYITDGGHVDDKTVYYFLKSSLEAIAALHQQNIVHRDVNPGNLIVCSGTDYAEERKEQAESKSPSSSHDSDSDDSSSSGKETEAPAQDKAVSFIGDEKEKSDPHTSACALVLIDLGLAASLPERGAVKESDAGTPNYYSPDLVRFAKGELKMTRELLYANDVWGVGATMYFVCKREELAKHYGLEEQGWDKAWQEVLDFQPPNDIYPSNLELNALILSCLSLSHKNTPSARELLDRLIAMEMFSDHKIPALEEKPTVAEEGKEAFKPALRHKTHVVPTKVNQLSGTKGHTYLDPDRPRRSRSRQAISSTSESSSEPEEEAPKPNRKQKNISLRLRGRSSSSSDSSKGSDGSDSASDSSETQSPVKAMRSNAVKKLQVSSSDDDVPLILNKKLCSKASREVEQLKPWYPARFAIKESSAASSTSGRVTRSLVLGKKRKRISYIEPDSSSSEGPSPSSSPKPSRKKIGRR